MQIADLVNHSHLLFVVRYDLDKAAHYVREERDAAEHQENCNKPFHVADGIVVTVADSGESRECIVTADDKFAPVRDVL